jgi:hypothetical protein
MSMRLFFHYAWASPNTAIGLVACALALRGGRVRISDGVVEAYGPLLSSVLARLPPIHGGVAAITLGHVVLARDAHTLAATRVHERVHVRQYERWGPLFIPAYAWASLWAFARGRHCYVHNVFEEEARRSE